MEQLCAFAVCTAGEDLQRACPKPAPPDHSQFKRFALDNEVHFWGEANPTSSKAPTWRNREPAAPIVSARLVPAMV